MENNTTWRPRLARDGRVALALGLMVGFGAAALAADAGPDELRAQRDAAFRAKDFTAAAELAQSYYAQLNRTQPRTGATADAAYVLGQALEQTGDDRGALEHFRTAIELNRELERGPQEIDAMTRAAAALTQRGKVASAVSVLQEALDRLSAMDQRESLLAANVQLQLATQYATLMTVPDRKTEVQAAEADQHAEQAGAIFAAAGARGHAGAATAMGLRGKAAEKRKDFVAAIGFYEQAIVHLEALGPGNARAVQEMRTRIAAANGRDGNANVPKTITATTHAGREVTLAVERGRPIRYPKRSDQVDPAARAAVHVTLGPDYAPVQQDIVLSTPEPEYGDRVREALASWRFVPVDDTPADDIAPFTYAVTFYVK